MSHMYCIIIKSGWEQNIGISDAFTPSSPFLHWGPTLD